MKKLIFLILAIVLFAGQALASRVITAEKFEATKAVAGVPPDGCDYSSWTYTETCTTNPDPDYTTVGLTGKISNMGSQCLYATILDGEGFNLLATLGSQNVFYSERTYIFSAQTIAEGSKNALVNAYTTAGANDICFRVFLENNGGDLVFRVDAYYDGTTPTTYRSDFIVSLDKPYILEVKWDYTAHIFSWKVNGIIQDTVDTAMSYPVGKIRESLSIVSTFSDEDPVTGVLDNIIYDNADWVGFEPTSYTSIKLMGLGDFHYGRVGQAADVDCDAELVDYMNWADTKGCDVVFTDGDNIHATSTTANIQAMSAGFNTADFSGLTLLGLGNHDGTSGVANADTCAGLDVFCGDLSAYAVANNNLLTYPRSSPYNTGTSSANGGNYTVNIGPVLQLVFFTNGISNATTHAAGDCCDAAQGLTWLDTTLTTAETNSKKVIVIQHLPSNEAYPGATDIVWKSDANFPAGTATMTGDPTGIGNKVTITSTGCTDRLESLVAGSEVYLTTDSGYVKANHSFMRGGYRKYGKVTVDPTYSTNGSGTGTIVCTVVLPFNAGATIYSAYCNVWQDGATTFNVASTYSNEKGTLDSHGSCLLAVISGHYHNGYYPENYQTVTVSHGGYPVTHYNMHSTWVGYDAVAYASSSEHDAGYRYYFTFDGTSTLTMTRYGMGNEYSATTTSHAGEGIKFTDADPAGTRYYGTYDQLLKVEAVTSDDIIDWQKNQVDDLVGASIKPEDSGAAAGDEVIYKKANFDGVAFDDNGKTHIRLQYSVLKNQSGDAITSTGAHGNQFYNLVFYNITGDGIQPTGDIATTNCIFEDVDGTDIVNGAGEETPLTNYADADGDPLFVSSTDFRLRSGSPCIDTGYNWGQTGTDGYGYPIPTAGFNIGWSEQDPASGDTHNTVKDVIRDTIDDTIKAY